jgi:hypothetical protein
MNRRRKIEPFVGCGVGRLVQPTLVEPHSRRELDQAEQAACDLLVRFSDVTTATIASASFMRARGENQQADCYRKVIAFVRQHPDDYDDAIRHAGRQARPAARRLIALPSSRAANAPASRPLWSAMNLDCVSRTALPANL